MSFITTYTKKYFDPLNVDESLLDIKDIAHALSLICRGNGHVQYFYSVAQHSLACAKEAKARGYSKEVILGCLLHDGSEVYLSDVTRPIKKELTYLKLQRKVDLSFVAFETIENEFIEFYKETMEI